MIPVIKSLSWPLLSTCTPAVESQFIHNPVKTSRANNDNINASQSPTFQQLMAARRLLCRHYYPETGWGWVIIVVGILVNTICHGLHLTFGVLINYIIWKYGVDYYDTGKFSYNFI